MEGAHEVLPGGGVDPRLAPDGRVDHGQQGRGDLDDGHAAQPGGGGEARQVRGRPAAQADDGAVPPQAQLAQAPPHRLQDGGGLGGLPAGHLDEFRAQAGPGQGAPRVLGPARQGVGVDEGHAPGPAAGAEGRS